MHFGSTHSYTFWNESLWIYYDGRAEWELKYKSADLG